MITKAKIYQSGIVLFLFLDSLSKYLANESGLANVFTINVMALSSLIVLFSMGQMARKIVGLAYYDPNDPKLIRIAHLTFFGRRNNLVVNLRDISALADTNAAKDDLFFKLVINVDGKQKMFFLANSKYATLDYEVYKRIFGNFT